jgi:hypothetical protein
MTIIQSLKYPSTVSAGAVKAAWDRIEAFRVLDAAGQREAA